MKSRFALGLVIAVVVVVLIVIFASYLYLRYRGRRIRDKLLTDRRYLQNVSRRLMPTQNIDLPIYYINLARSPERNKFVIDQFRLYGIENYTRIEGVDGSADPSVKYKNYFKNLKPLTNGEIGCTLSHLRAIKTAYDDGLKTVLILEDDVILDYAPYWDGPLSQYLQQAPKDWRVLQLYSSLDYTKIKEKYHRPKGDAWGALAYVINREGMAAVLKQTLRGDTFVLTPEISRLGAADSYIYAAAGTRYVTNPPLFSHFNVDLPSTIFETPFDIQLGKAARVVEYYVGKAKEIRKNF